MTIKNVDVDVLGRYDVVVTIGDSESRNDTVWLTLKGNSTSTGQPLLLLCIALCEFCKPRFLPVMITSGM